MTNQFGSPETIQEVMRRLMQGTPRNSTPIPQQMSAPVQAIPSFGAMMPYGGLKNEALPPYTPPGATSQYMPPMGQTPMQLPPYMQPGGSLPFENYLQPRPPQQPMPQAPQQMPQPQPMAPQAQPPEQMVDQPPFDMEAIRRAALEAWRNKPGQWAVNQGSARDQGIV